MLRQVRLSHELPTVTSQAYPGSLIALHRIAQRVHRLSSFELGKTLGIIMCTICSLYSDFWNSETKRVHGEGLGRKPWGGVGFEAGVTQLWLWTSHVT